MPLAFFETYKRLVNLHIVKICRVQHDKVVSGRSLVYFQPANSPVRHRTLKGSKPMCVIFDHSIILFMQR